MKQKKEVTRFVFDRRRQATPTTPARVELEIYFTRNSRKIIPTDIMLLPHQWHEGKIINHPSAHSLMVKLEGMRMQYEKMLLRMEAGGVPLDLQSFNAYVDDTATHGEGSF